MKKSGTALLGLASAALSVTSAHASFSATYLGAGAFQNNTGLQSITVDANNTVYSSIRSVDTAITKNDSSSLGLAFNISNTAATTGIAIARIPNYFNTVAPKNFSCFSQATYSSNTAQWVVSQVTGVYNSTSAISSITLFPASGNWTSGTAYVYGVQ